MTSIALIQKIVVARFHIQRGNDLVSTLQYWCDFSRNKMLWNKIITPAEKANRCGESLLHSIIQFVRQSSKLNVSERHAQSV